MINHPVTGRPILFVNPMHTHGFAGMERDEAWQLIEELAAHATQEQFIYYHSWRVGDVLDVGRAGDDAPRRRRLSPRGAPHHAAHDRLPQLSCALERIDLRSDTVTLPSPGMRRAMAAAPVGDDQYGEDPSVNQLQARVAELLGKEAALFVPSGTMANQIGLKILTRPGDDLVVGEEAHIVWHESGAAAANSGVQFTVVGRRGLFGAADLRAAYKPPGHIVFPPTTLVAIENTHNRGGGVVFPQSEVVAICAAARESGWPAISTARGCSTRLPRPVASLAELAAPFDVVSVALSKGLGLPGR